MAAATGRAGSGKESRVSSRHIEDRSSGGSKVRGTIQPHSHTAAIQHTQLTAKKTNKSPKGSPRKHKQSPQEPLEMGIKNMEIVDDETVIQTVEVLKRPGQTLGFYIREGNGINRNDGVFISRIAPGSVVENNGLLRVGDEILTVNSVDVTHTSLDDVVILMSIPKRLVLSIRTLRNYPKNASCLSLCIVEQEPNPVVIVKNMGSSSASVVEMSEKYPDEFILASTEARAYYAKQPPGYVHKLEDMRRAKNKPTPPPPYKLTTPGERQYVGDDSGDSGLSSENSGYSRAGEGSSQGSQPQHGTTIPGHYQGNVLERAVDDLDSIPMDSAHLQEVLKEAGKSSPKLSPREGQGAVAFRSPRAPRRGMPGQEDLPPYVSLDYSSDTDSRGRYIPHHQRSASISGAYSNSYPRHYDLNSIKAFQEEIERTHGRYEAQGFLTMNRNKVVKARSASPDCYNSDSEVVYTRMRERTSPGREVISRLLDTDDRCNSLPRMDGGENAEEIKHWLRKFDSLQYELQQQQQQHQHQQEAASMDPNINHASGKSDILFTSIQKKHL